MRIIVKKGPFKLNETSSAFGRSRWWCWWLFTRANLDTTDSLIKPGRGRSGLLVEVSNFHAGDDIQNVSTSLFDFFIIIHEKYHGHAVNFMGQGNITRIGKSTIGTQLDKIPIVLVHNFSSDVKSYTGSQVQLGNNPTNMIINLTLSLW